MQYQEVVLSTIPLNGGRAMTGGVPLSLLGGAMAGGTGIPLSTPPLEEIGQWREIFPSIHLL